MSRESSNPFIERDCESGALFLQIHYSADPLKDAKWAAAEKKTANDPRGWEREMELDDGVYSGEPVWREYIDDLHAPVLFRTTHLPVYEGSTFYGGWDCGPTRQPAFALAQLTKLKQVLWMGEVVPQVAMGMARFAPIVKAYLKKRMPGHWSRIVHFGDETGRNKSGTDDKSAFMVALEHGFIIRPTTNNLHVREQAVVGLLTEWISQEGDDPDEWIQRSIYGMKDCPVLVEGMRGAYCMRNAPNTAQYGPGMEVRLPRKNFYSHVNDAHQYASVPIWQLLRSQKPKTGTRYGRNKRREHKFEDD